MSPKKLIELSYETIDDIVITELQEAYIMNAKPDKVDCSDDVIEPDLELLQAFDKVLDYFMDKEQRDNWADEKVRQNYVR